MGSIKSIRNAGVTTRTITVNLDRDWYEIPVRVTASLIPGSQGVRENRTGLPMEPDTESHFDIEKVIVMEDVWDEDENGERTTLIHRKGAKFEPTLAESIQIERALFNSLAE